MMDLVICTFREFMERGLWQRLFMWDDWSVWEKYDELELQRMVSEAWSRATAWLQKASVVLDVKSDPGEVLSGAACRLLTHKCLLAWVWLFGNKYQIFHITVSSFPVTFNKYFCSLCSSKLRLVRAVTFPSSALLSLSLAVWKRKHISFRFPCFSAMLAFHVVVCCPAASWSWWKTLIQHRSMLNQSSRQKWNVTPNCEVWAGASDDWEGSGGRPITSFLWDVESQGLESQGLVSLWDVSTEQKENPFCRWKCWITDVEAGGWGRRDGKHTSLFFV